MLLKMLIHSGLKRQHHEFNVKSGGISLGTDKKRYNKSSISLMRDAEQSE
jgi:hypothetical protein